MNSNFEDQLRSDFAQVEAHPHPDLAQAAYQAHRRHHQVRRRTTMAATGCAAAVAGAAVGVVVTAAPAAKPVNVTTASLAAHITSALSTTNLMAKVDYQTTSGLRLEEWSYGKQIRITSSCDSGKPLMDESANLTGLSKTTGLADVHSLTVDYSRSTWSNGTGIAPMTSATCGNNHGPETVAILLDPQPASIQSSVKEAVKVGAFKVIGHQQINGKDTIALQLGAQTGPSLWIDPSTYLPVRWTLPSVTGPHGATLHETADYAWLPVTAANLANLSVTIPKGFHQTKP